MHLLHVCAVHTMNSKDLISKQTRGGWFLDRVKISHHIYKHPAKAGHISLLHPKKDLGAGLVAKPLKAAGL